MDSEKQATNATIQDTQSDVSPKAELSIRSAFVIFAAALSLFVTVGFANAFGVFQQYYTSELLRGKSDFQISWIGSFATFMTFACAPIAGYINDKHGPTIPLSIGAICEVIALFMTSLCTEYYQLFLAQGILLGFSFAFVSIPAASIVPLYFQRNRAVAQGVVVAGSSLGGVIWPIALDQMLGRDQISFAWALRIVAFVTLAILAVVVVGVRRPRPAASTDDASKSKRSEEVEKEDDDPATATAAAKEDAAQQMKTDLARLRHPSFLLLCVGLMIIYLGFFAPFFFISTYAVSLGVSDSFAFYLISILNAASFFGRILPGLVADRVGAFNILTLALFGSAIVAFCWSAVTTAAGLVVFAIAFGFVSGAILSLQFVVVTLIATRATTGTAIGILLGCISITALFGGPIAGELVKSGYVSLSMFTGATLLVGAILTLGARLAKTPKLLAKV